MPLKSLYVIARNASGKATLQHKLIDGTSSRTKCGIDVTHWTRAYQRQPIEQVLCLRPQCRP